MSSSNRLPLDGTSNNRRSVLYSVLDEPTGSSNSLSQISTSEKPLVRPGEHGEKATPFSLFDEEAQDQNDEHTWSKGIRTVNPTHARRKRRRTMILGIIVVLLVGALVCFSTSTWTGVDEGSPINNVALNDSRGRDFHPVGGEPGPEPEIMTEAIGEDPNIPDEDPEEYRRFTTSEGNYRVTIIHTNDIHSHLDPFSPAGNECTQEDIDTNECLGGIAKHKKIIEKIREDRGSERRVLLMDAGDQFQGTLYYKVHHGQVSADYMNLFRYDVATLGNHEFDDGPEFLYENYLSRIDFPMVCANLNITRYSEFDEAVKRSVVLSGGIGVIGALTTSTLFKRDPQERVSVYDVVSSVQVEIDRLQRLGVNKIVLLSHIGYEEDQEVASKTKGIDLIVGGHSHSLLTNDESEEDREGPYPTIVKDLDGREVRIVTAKYWGSHLGVFNVDFDTDGEVVNFEGGPIHITHDLESDGPTEELLKPYREAFDEFRGKVLGKTNTEWVNSECREAECPLGNVIADAYRTAIPGIAILNGGSIRAGFAPGDISQADVMNVLPFGNDLVKLPLRGSELLDTLQGFSRGRNVVSDEPVYTSPQVSGLKYVVDNETKELVSAEILVHDEWIQIDPNEEYDIVTNDYLARGGDNLFTVAWDKPNGLMKEEDALTEYIESKQVLKKPKDDNRIEIIGEADPAGHGHMPTLIFWAIIFIILGTLAF